ncbi:MAG: pentapeptide repeat-containing protein [Gammaproteobacteria bacterium]|nr:pentapeptide repeat-containing protein [Gammaproteobacteria bacterium]MDH3372668.1 pentapeptide repeat-containing protein [Gammaproteobacteria bacterium]MDH3408590.1 pentapeptide repeat-containing protein [Gammaproteobacteria bacterium]MDH3551807.1 pentapeptide repeat-containing protein [Gammaproteobacteria bacterium]
MANPDHVDRLRRGEFKLADNPSYESGFRLGSFKPDLAGADLRESDMRGVDLRYADLRGANLHGADLTGADLGSANLADADFSYATLVDVSFSRIHVATNLRMANFERANLLNARFGGVEAQAAQFTAASLDGADFTGGPVSNAVLDSACFEDASLRDANLSWQRMRNANLSGADLTKAQLLNADLSGSNLSGTCFRLADLSDADLSGSFCAANKATDFWSATLDGAKLRDVVMARAYFQDASLARAALSGGDFSRASFYRANAERATLHSCKLHEVNLTDANFAGADFDKGLVRLSDLTRCQLAGATFRGATICDNTVFGCSAWDTNLEGAYQSNLRISQNDEPNITVDNLAVAQFVYLLVENANLRGIIDTLTSKTVLILGRFTPDRKEVLEAIRRALRDYDLVPILFDFEKPASRDLTETVSTLARMAKFVIADLTEPSSIPLELQEIVPTVAVPVKPIIAAGHSEFSMFRDLRKKYRWVMPTLTYESVNELISSLPGDVIDSASELATQLRS